MGLTSLQVCMDSSDWFQGTIQEETGMDSSSPSGITDPMLACSRPLMERRLRPQHDQALKCPRCDSNHTKFCYYNNYSLTQPRYFCKTCRRYWTKGGTLRNIPVGGGCRKNKKVSTSSKKSTSAATANNNNSSSESSIHYQHHQQQQQQNPHLISPNHPLIMNSTDLQLSYPESSMQFSASNLFGIGTSTNIPSFMFENLNSTSATRAIDFMESGGGGSSGGNHFMGMMGNGGYAAEMGGANGMAPNYHGTNLCSPFGGMTLDGINNTFMERGMIVYDHEGNDVNEDTMNGLDVKPKLLALEWQDQTGCSSDHHGPGAGAGAGVGGYLTGLGSSWNGLMNAAYGPSTTNPLV